jgi:hypothetical protein
MKYMYLGPHVDRKDEGCRSDVIWFEQTGAEAALAHAPGSPLEENTHVYI